MPKVLQIVKPEIRVLGVDDGRFVFHSRSHALVVGAVFRGGNWLEGVMSTCVEVDGLDATAKIISMIKASPHFRQVRVIMLNGITMGGFNVIDVKRLALATGKPVIAVTTKKPRLDQMHSALKNLPHYEERWKTVLNAGEVFAVVTRGEKHQVYAEIAGVTKDVAIKILRLTATRSKVPEPLRVAHLIASGISL